MQNTITVKIRMFGPLRKYSPSVQSLQLPGGISIAGVREQLISKLEQACQPFPDGPVIKKSAFATEVEVLREEHVLTRNTTLAVLPPVCGG